VGSLKDKASKTNPRTLEELINTIGGEISTIYGQTLQGVNAFRSCTDYIRSGGQNFQHLI
jgi:hypothetical protein